MIKNFDRNNLSEFLNQNMQIAYLVVKEKKGKFCTKMLLVPTGQEFRPECNVAIFAQKLVDSI